MHIAVVGSKTCPMAWSSVVQVASSATVADPCISCDDTGPPLTVRPQPSTVVAVPACQAQVSVYVASGTTLFPNELAVSRW